MSPPSGSLPWSGINTITIGFSQNVSITADHIHLYGVNTKKYPATFAYDSSTRMATLTLDAAMDCDKLLLVIDDTVTDVDGNALDGEWENEVSTVSGDGGAGGHLQFRLNVLPGDATDSGNVVAADVSVLASAFGAFAGGGDDQYSAFTDFDGSGNVVAADVSLMASRFGEFLPSADPVLVNPLVVTGVYVGSTRWGAEFNDWLRNDGISDAKGYYQVPTDRAQLDTLPWSGLSRVRLSFSEDVHAEISHLMLVGTEDGEVSASDFDYDADTWTGTWTFPAMEADKYLLCLSDDVTATGSGLSLDGDHVDASGKTESGNTIPGGDFPFRFNVLPGDATDSGNVVAADVSMLASAFGSFAGGGKGRYSPFLDFDGSGNIVAADVSILASRFGQFLSNDDPLEPQSENTVSGLIPPTSAAVSRSTGLDSDAAASVSLGAENVSARDTASGSIAKSAILKPGSVRML